MDRRTFLAAAVGMPVAAMAVSCRTTASAALSIAPLEGSLPLQLIQGFERQLNEAVKIAVTPKESLIQLYETLQVWQSAAAEADDTSASTNHVPADWLTLTDYWLSFAIQQNLIQPIGVEALAGWEQLDPRWQQLVQRNRQGKVEADAPVWGVPYRWGSLAILYNTARSGQDGLSTWADLLKPELRRRVILPDHPRLVIGLALKALGASANVEDPAAVKGLTKFLASLQQQVRVYSSDHYLEALIIGDATAVVGWDVDILPILDQYRTFTMVIPPQGTLLCADLWVQPAVAQASSLALDWLKFSLSSDFAEQLAIYDLGQSPRLWALAADEWPEPLQREGLIPSMETRAESEFLYPLEASVEERYNQLWRELRR